MENGLEDSENKIMGRIGNSLRSLAINDLRCNN